MTEVRYHPGRTGPTTIPIIDITDDYCPCGAIYTTRNGNPDRTLYDLWCDHHLPHMDP